MWVLPTFNRPGLLKRTIKHCRKTGMTTKGLILVNGGEQKAYNWLRTEAPKNWMVEFLPENLGVAGAMQYAFGKYPDEPWYGWFADDLVPRTQGWDKALVAGLDSHLIASAVNNWHNPPRFQTGVVRGSVAREVGWLHIPGTWGCYSDDFWERLGTDLGSWKVCKDVVVETLNPRKNDYAWDDASEATYNESTFAKDGAIWAEFQENEYRTIRERIREKFNVGAPRVVNLSQASVLICTPSADGKLVSQYVTSLTLSITKMRKLGIGYGLYILDKCSILPHARNRLVAEFLATSATHMLFIDDDMGWSEDAIPELLAHDRDVIAAVGITKDEDPEKRRFCATLEHGITAYDDERGLVRVKGVGTGFMLIKRHVLEKLWKEYRKNASPPPPENPAVGPISRLFEYDYEADDWGEDYTFCRRWREMGGEVWVDPSLRLEHIGSFSFTGTYMDWLKGQYEHGREQAA